ncbi:MAG TPA: hypothetical protein VHB30_01560, partial [Solirubrobacteraceae bacterium]|nr:hypothetical protein [Solirubrobacteraceae bacterium]
MGDHPRLADARGFTVVELVVAIAAGLVVLLGAFTIIDHTFAETQTVTRRDDAAARGRQALDLIVRQLRAQVCLQTNPPTTPIVSGDGKSIVFYAYLGDPTTATTTTQYDSGSGQPYPVKHTLAYTSVGGNPGSITETDAPVTSFSPVTVGAATTRTLVTDVVPPSGGAIFTYYGPSSSGS